MWVDGAPKHGRLLSGGHSKMDESHSVCGPTTLSVCLIWYPELWFCIYVCALDKKDMNATSNTTFQLLFHIHSLICSEMVHMPLICSEIFSTLLIYSEMLPMPLKCSYAIDMLWNISYAIDMFRNVSFIIDMLRNISCAIDKLWNFSFVIDMLRNVSSVIGMLRNIAYVVDMLRNISYAIDMLQLLYAPSVMNRIGFEWHDTWFCI